MKKREVRGPFHRVACDYMPEGESMTKQSFKDDCDVNRIMKRFQQTGIVDHVNKFAGDYGDYTDLPQSYHEACNQVLEAESMFMSLPSTVRSHFDNDPGKFLAAVDGAAKGNGFHENELRELGVLPRQSSGETGIDNPPEPTGSGDPPAERKSPEGSERSGEAPAGA